MKHDRKRAIRGAPAQAAREPAVSTASEATKVPASPSGRPVALSPNVRELEREAHALAASATPLATSNITAHLHTDAAANATARAHGAKAVTLGEQIYFAEGAFRPDTRDGQRRIKHELAHVEQHRVGRVPQGVALRDEHDDPDRAGDVAPPPPRPAGGYALEPDPVTPFDPIIDSWDPATFWTPPGVTREEIAQRLYGDPGHVGGFDIVGEKHVRMRTFEGVTASDFLTAMREALDRRLHSDVTNMVSLANETFIDSAEERRMVDNWAWWANRGDLTNTAGTGYFDAYLNELDTHQITQWGLFGDTTRPASEVMELESDMYSLMRMRGVRSSRGGTRYPTTGRRVEEWDRVIGPIPMTGLSGTVGAYTYREPAPRMALYSTTYGNADIYVTRQLVDETTATRAETELRNSPHRGPRVMIPGGNGHFYGYAVSFPFFEEDYQPTERTMTNYWWYYPGTVFVQGGEYRADFGAGASADVSHRVEILTRALNATDSDAIRGLDFDVLSVASNDLRYTLIERAIGGRTAGDATLIARILYSIPPRDFPAFERRMSTSGLMNRLLGTGWPEGAMLAMGRVFSIRALQTMRVPGENLEALPELTSGVDGDGYYHYAVPSWGNVASQAVANFGPDTAVGIGNEPVVEGGTGGPMQRSSITLQPSISRLSNVLANTYRGVTNTLFVNDGPAIGPMLPTQLVRVRMLGPNATTRTVTAFEAFAITQMPAAEVFSGYLSAHISGGAWLMAGMQLTRVFGPALAEALLAGAGVRVVAGAVGRAAATEAGVAALTNTALVGGVTYVESNRREIATTDAGRAFLELYDVTMVIWLSRDIARLVASGLVPRLAAAVDAMGTAATRVRDGLMPLRAEIEAMSRAIARYNSRAEAAEAALAESGTAVVPGSGNRLSFSANLMVARGEVAAETLAARVAGTPLQATTTRVLRRLEGAVERAETALGDAAGTEAQAAARARVDRLANARANIAARANRFRPDARDAYLRAVDAAISARPNSLDSIADLLTAAANSRQPNVFMAEVQALISRPGVSPEALTMIGRKVLQGSRTLDLAWLNRTTLDDATLDFLARDSRTPWDLFRRVSLDPGNADLMRQLAIRGRGIGGEIAADPVVEGLGTNVERQVRMGSSEIDYAMTVAGRRRGFEMKAWTPATWRDALNAATRRLDGFALTEAEAEVVRKFDTLVRQLRDIRTATGATPYLGVTDALTPELRALLRRDLQRSGVALPDANVVRISEAAIAGNARLLRAAIGVP